MSEGVFLPDVAPEVGEMVLATIRANPAAQLTDVILALIATSPPELAPELLHAAVQLVALRREKASLVWLRSEAGLMLLGLDELHDRATVRFGPVRWPLQALMSGPPQLVRIGTSKGSVPVWFACEGLRDTVLRVSDVVGIAMAVFEAAGAKLIEDRAGKEAAAASLRETAISQHAKRIAEARDEVRRLRLFTRAEDRGAFARVPLAEAIPGLLQVGDELVPIEGEPHVFVVERRVNDDWVTLVAREITGFAGAGGWRYADNRDTGPGGFKHAGFTDEDCEPVNQPVKLPPQEPQPAVEVVAVPESNRAPEGGGGSHA